MKFGGYILRKAIYLYVCMKFSAACIRTHY